LENTNKEKMIRKVLVSILFGLSALAAHAELGETLKQSIVADIFVTDALRVPLAVFGPSWSSQASLV
jgi:hypothetical protein